MAKMVNATYDAEHQTLQLLEPLDGFESGDQVTAFVNRAQPGHPLKEVSGILDDEAGESFARAVEEMFPIEK